jgi:hypothetical protein
LEREYNVKHATKAASPPDSRDRFRDVLQGIDFETQDSRYGTEFQTTVRQFAEQGNTALLWRDYHRNYQNDITKRVDNLVIMVTHLSLDTRMTPTASALRDYGARLSVEGEGFVRRAGLMMALQALVETPKVCRGLAARLQKQLARYEPELWKVLEMEAPPALASGSLRQAWRSWCMLGASVLVGGNEVLWAVIELCLGGIAFFLSWIVLYQESTRNTAQPLRWYVVFTFRFLFATFLVVDGIWRLLFGASVIGI